MSRSKAEMLKRQARRVTAVVLMAAMLFMVIPASTLPFISARAEAGPAVSGSDILSAEETGEAPVSFSDLSVSGSDAATSGSDVNITESHPVFAQSAAANGVTVTVSAPVGVFPAGAELSVTALGAAAGGKVEKLIGADKDADCYSFDIKVMLNGEEIQPDSAYGNVSVRFSLADIPANTDVSVYHVNDAVTSSEEMAPVVSGDSVSVSTDSFSIFVIELTHGGYYYTMAGDVAVEIGVIAEALGITGTVTAAGSSDESCLAVELGEDGYLYAVPMSAFVGEVILVIEIDGTTDYEVSVATLDVELERVAWFEYNAPGIGQPGGIMVRNTYGGTEDLYIDCGDGNIVPYTDDFVVAGDRVDIYAEGTGLSSIDARGNGYVSFIECAENIGINELLISDASMLTGVQCINNDLFELDAAGCYSLGYISCGSNDVSYLNLSDCTGLYALSCGDNPMYDLDLSANTNLMTLLCANTNINGMDLRDHSLLSYVDVSFSPYLYYINLGSHPVLDRLLCAGSGLDELDLSGCPALSWLDCSQNNLTELDLSACAGLKHLNAAKNNLSSVTLGCDPAQLEEIDLSENRLTFLTLPVPGADTEFDYSNQAPIVLPASIEPGVALETLAPYDTNGTEFGWFEVGALEGDEENIYSEDAVVTFTEEDVGRAYMAGMANDKFGDTVIFTTDVTVVSGDEYCTVSFDANGGEGTMLDQVMLSGFEYILHANEFTREHYRFAGWSTDKDSKEVAYADGAAVKDIFTSGQDTMTLYAVWAIDLLPQAVITVDGPGAAFYLDVAGGDADSIVSMDFFVDLGDGELQTGGEFDVVALGNTVTIYAKPGREMANMYVMNSTGAISVDITAAGNLRQLQISDSTVDQLVIDNPLLVSLGVENCGIDSVDLTGCPNLCFLYLAGNDLTSIDVSGMDELQVLSINDNQLTEMNIGDNPELVMVEANNNLLSELDTSGCPKLDALIVRNNQISSFDFSANPCLGSLRCSGNQLTSLDFSSNPDIMGLSCENNFLGFSSLLDPNKTFDNPYYYVDQDYAPQGEYKIQEAVAATSVLDLSSEAEPFGSPTTYKWYYADGTAVEPEYITENGGKFSFAPALAGEEIYCAMTNPLYPDLTLVTTKTQVYADSFEYVVLFDANGGEGTMADQTFTYNVEQALSANTFTREGYTFTGWEDAEGNAYTDKQTVKNLYTDNVGTVTLYAQWEAETFTVTWQNEDGTELEVDTDVPYGAVPSYDGATPVKPSDDAKDYTFVGWTPILSEVTGDVVYTAKYTDDTREYTVTWKNGADAIYAENLLYGTVPAYDSAKYGVPAKESTAEEDYTFAGWDPEISVVTGEITYYAQFTATPREYTVLWKNHDGAVLESDTVKYGDTPVYDGVTPVKDDDAQYTYTFTGWDPAIEAVTGDAVYTAQFGDKEAKEYTITFDTDGGTLVDPITQAFGTDVTAPADPTKEGYTFDGWDKEIPATMPAENMTITAQWDANKYTITFDTNGGSLVDPITQDYGTDVTAPNAPAKEGYTFVGWDKEIPATMPAKNMIITAQWDPNQYTITFDTKGGTPVDPITQNYGTDVTAPAEPAKEGYTFVGWDKEIPATMPAENMTITAQWDTNSYIIVYHANNHVVPEETDTQHINFDATFNLRGDIFDYADLVLAGWTTQADGNGTEYALGQEVKNLTAENGAVIDLYAKWADDPQYGNDRTVTIYTVDENGDPMPNVPVQLMLNTNQGGLDGFSLLGAVVTTDENGVAVITDGALDTVKRLDTIYCNIAGDCFDWALDPTAEKVRDAEAIYNTQEKKDSGGKNEYIDVLVTEEFGFDTAFTLSVKRAEYTVEFDANTGDGTMDDQSVSCGVATALNANEFTKTGCSFVEWNTAADGSGTAYADKAEVTNIAVPGETLKLYAQWKANKYTVTFNANGGEVDPTSKTVVYDSAYGELPVPTRTGYTFIEWKLNDEVITADSIVKTAEDHTLVAQWEANEYTVTFNADGGEVNPASKTVVYDFAYGTLPVPTKDGYEFVCWKLDDEAITADSIVKTAEDVTLTAQWRSNERAITFDTDGGSAIAPIVQDIGTAVTAPADPTKEGYTFTGWDKELPAVMPAEDMTVTAQWEANEYTVTFDANGGEGTMADQSFTYDEAQNLTANAFTKEGCEFTGWKDADGNEYTDGQSVKNLTSEDGGKVTLTAQWETLPTYKVTVTATAGGTVTPSQVEAVEGEDVTFTLTPDNDRYEITSVKVNGTAVDVSKLPASGKGKALTVSDISADTAVEVTFAAEPIVGTASVNMKNGQTFYVNEDITFTAIGSWPDSATTYINGDQYYVPLNWHHADPSGDWGGKDDPSFTYSATFKQAATGKYTLKVEFQRYTHNGTTWEADGIVTIAREYTVTTRSAGTGGEVPKTGDTTMTSGTGVTIAVNAILLSIVFVVLYLRRRGRTVVFYE